jgi:hypothetical protein
VLIAEVTIQGEAVDARDMKTAKETSRKNGFERGKEF